MGSRENKKEEGKENSKKSPSWWFKSISNHFKTPSSVEQENVSTSTAQLQSSPLPWVHGGRDSHQRQRLRVVPEWIPPYWPVIPLTRPERKPPFVSRRAHRHHSVASCASPFPRHCRTRTLHTSGSAAVQTCSAQVFPSHCIKFSMEHSGDTWWSLINSFFNIEDILNNYFLLIEIRRPTKSPACSGSYLEISPFWALIPLYIIGSLRSGRWC